MKKLGAALLAAKLTKLLSRDPYFSKKYDFGSIWGSPRDPQKPQKTTTPKKQRPPRPSQRPKRIPMALRHGIRRPPEGPRSQFWDNFGWFLEQNPNHFGIMFWLKDLSAKAPNSHKRTSGSKDLWTQRAKGPKHQWTKRPKGLEDQMTKGQKEAKDQRAKDHRSKHQKCF